MTNVQRAAALILVGSCLLLGETTAFAAPSTSGATGLIRIPTADSLRPGHFSAGYFYWQDHSTAVAAAGLPAGLEVSAAAPWYKGATGNWTVNAKVALTQEGLLLPAIAIGAEDIGEQNQRSYYAAVSKALPFGFRIHVGAGTGRFKGMFGAVEKVLNPTSLRKKRPGGFPVTSLIVEMDGQKMNYGARMSLMHGVRLDAGWLGREQRVYLGLTYTN
ncbi:MAG: YjbH domain-containing protein [Veillonellaceae bacterium]|jgi:hypothetical protein|nr:YjbH domain-containing protein [Veillonellaceae bacterium]